MDTCGHVGCQINSTKNDKHKPQRWDLFSYHMSSESSSSLSPCSMTVWRVGHWWWLWGWCVLLHCHVSKDNSPRAATLHFFPPARLTDSNRPLAMIDGVAVSGTCKSITVCQSCASCPKSAESHVRWVCRSEEHATRSKGTQENLKYRAQRKNSLLSHRNSRLSCSLPCLFGLFVCGCLLFCLLPCSLADGYLDCALVLCQFNFCTPPSAKMDNVTALMK